MADPAVAVSSAEAVAVAAALRRARVGGAFWAPPRPLPAGRDILLAPDNAVAARALQDDAASRGEAARCVLIGPCAGRHGIPVIAGLCDPWHLVGGASEVVARADTELGLVAQLAEEERIDPAWTCFLPSAVGTRPAIPLPPSDEDEETATINGRELA